MTILQRYRWLSTRLPDAGERRIAVMAGARQTGKTTLARSRYDTLRYLNLDDADLRSKLKALRAPSWAATVGSAILDEAQKEPGVLEKLKYAFDAGAVDFSLVLGSARILLLKQVGETLAGRAFFYDLWPLMPSEILHAAEDSPKRPLIDALLCSTQSLAGLLGAQAPALLGEDEEPLLATMEYLSAWGGMPSLLSLNDEGRREWLRSYQRAWLERDLSDLARLDDLEPFRSLQRLAMLRSGQLLSYAGIGRDAGVASSTARRYLGYLRISYQVVLLQPYARNLTSSTVKSPKLYWVDLGLLRQGLNRWGELDGAMFETLVVSEVHKWVSTMATDTPLYFYRTRSGREVDLLAQRAEGLLGMEIKNRARVVSSDLGSLRSLAKSLGPQWYGGLVVYRGSTIDCLDEEHRIWSMPVHRLFAPPAPR